MNNKKTEHGASMVDLMPSACEAELQNLMYHIDQMIQAKRKEWERELQMVEARVSSKERECALLRADLDEQTREMESLRVRLVDAGRNSGEQVQTLREELMALGQQHERVSRKYRKQELLRQKEAAAAKSQLQAEAVALAGQLSDAASDKQRLQWELAEVRAQRDSAEEKLQLLQEQSAAYADQLDKRKRLSESAEAGLRRIIEQLEQQVAKSQEQLAGYTSGAARLKAQVADGADACRQFAEERERLEAELLTSRKATQRAEVEASRLAMELRARETELRELHRDCRTSVGDADAAAAGCERGCQTELTGGELVRLAEELQSLRLRARELAQRERRTAEEAEAERAEADQSAGQLRRQCRELAAELESARAASARQGDAGRAQLEGLRDALAGLESQLAGITTERDRHADRVAAAERKSATAAEEAERRQVELSLASAQLEAARAENAQLRGGLAAGSLAQSRDLQRSQAAWEAERRRLLDRLTDAEARAERAEAENLLLSNFAEDVEESVESSQSFVRLIDGHVTELKRQTDLVLSQAPHGNPAGGHGRLALPAPGTSSAASAHFTPSAPPVPQFRKLMFT